MRNASAGHAGFARIMIGQRIQGLVKGDFTVWRAIGVRCESLALRPSLRGASELGLRQGTALQVLFGMIASP